MSPHQNILKKMLHLFRYAAAIAIVMFLLKALGASPVAHAKPIFDWEMGIAIPLRNTKYISPISGEELDPESPVFFQTKWSAGYRFYLQPWFFIAPMGYYRLMVGALDYRDINGLFNINRDPNNQFYQHQFINNELAMGSDFGFIIQKWSIITGLYIGASGDLEKFSTYYFSDRSPINEGVWQTDWHFVIVPRLAVDYRIAPNVDMGGVVDYRFAPTTKKAKADFINIAIRATFLF
ncbi:MAG: hypothetical protein ACR2NY_04155 [Alphaproteobacteria bacterium]